MTGNPNNNPMRKIYVEKTKVKDFYASFFQKHVMEEPEKETKKNGANNQKPEETPPPPSQVI